LNETHFIIHPRRIPQRQLTGFAKSAAIAIVPAAMVRSDTASQRWKPVAENDRKIGIFGKIRILICLPPDL
jgi:hypothetical protein